MRLIAICVAFLALAVAACGQRPIPIGHAIATASPTPLPSGGISRDQAVAIATTGMNMTDYHVESAVFGKFSQFAPGQGSSHSTDKGTFTSSPDELVWAVTIGGQFLHPCPCCGPCDVARHETVLIDYFNGQPMIYILRA